jgi:hypothetical protein
MGVALVLAAYYFTINLMLPDSADPDEGVYLMVARLLEHGQPYHVFFFDQFWLFPQVLAFAFHWFGDSAVTGRLTIVAFSLGGLLAMALLTRQLGAKWAAPLVILAGAVNHYYLTQSRFTMTDVPSLALMLWALVTMLAFTTRGQRGWLACSGALAAASFLVKPLTVGFGVALGVWLLAHRIRRTQGHWQIEWRALLVDLGVFGGAGLLLAAPFVNLFDLPGEFQRTIGFHWDEKDWYAPQLALRQFGLVSFVAENRMWWVLALGGVLASLRRVPLRVTPLLVGELLSAYVLLDLPPFWHHYTLLAPILMVLVAVGLQAGVVGLLHLSRALFVRARRPLIQPRLAFELCAAVLALAGLVLWVHDLPSLVHYNARALNERAHNADAVVQYLERTTAPGDYLISDNVMIIYLADRLMPPPAMNLPYESTFRFAPESQAKLLESVTRYPVTAIVVTGPYKHNSKLMDWIETNFPLQESAGSGKSDTVIAQIYRPRPLIAHPLSSPIEPEPSEYSDDYWQHWQ